MGGCWEALVMEHWEPCRGKELWVGADEAKEDEKGEGDDEEMEAWAAIVVCLGSFSTLGLGFSVLFTLSSLLLPNIWRGDFFPTSPADASLQNGVPVDEIYTLAVKWQWLVPVPYYHIAPFPTHI